jgi:hypothetical protein
MPRYIKGSGLGSRNIRFPVCSTTCAHCSVGIFCVIIISVLILMCFGFEIVSESLIRGITRKTPVFLEM